MHLVSVSQVVGRGRHLLMEWLNYLLRRNDALLVLESVLHLLLLLNRVLGGHCILHLHQVQVEVLLHRLLGEG